MTCAHTASDAPIGAVVEFLRGHAPFDEMDQASLEFLAARTRLALYPKSSVVASWHGEAKTLHIVERGLIRGVPVTPAEGDAADFAPGECFPLSVVHGGDAESFVYTAIEDSACYEIDASGAEELARRSPPFEHFYGHYMASLYAQARRHLQAQYIEQTLAQGPMLEPLGSIIIRPPVCCGERTSLKDALTEMQRRKVGSIVITAEDGAPTGIFTERDLLKYTAEGRVDREAPIEHFMTRDPVSLPASATAYDAALVMARHGIRHMLVVEQGRLTGVVSERSLFALQRRSIRNVVHAIEIAENTDGLMHAAQQIRELAHGMLAQGIAAEQLTQLISVLNDSLVARVVALEAPRHDLAGLRWCWLALGSEGRQEQTISTDQDNALIFEAPPRTLDGDSRWRVLRFAKAVNDALDACGYPLCRGNIMAGNPECCLSAREWRERFSDWVRNPTPHALLNATIFFDFRALAGEHALAEALRAWLRDLVKGDERFLKTMALNALESGVPLGLFGRLVTGGKDPDFHTIDLKTQGTRVVTDAARIYALASGIEATGTAARLRLSGEALGVPGIEVEALVEAFYFLLLFRLRHQHLEEAAGHAPNRVAPDKLNELDRRILKEALRQARRIQRRLALDYQR